jgi:hypothetical protein
MPKNPENMTPAEMLTRIRSLERRLRESENRAYWAEHEQKSVRHWAEEAWKEIRRLHDVIEHHWDVRQEALRLLGLPEEQRSYEIARFDYETRTWEPAHPELTDDIGPPVQEKP